MAGKRRQPRQYLPLQCGIIPMIKDSLRPPCRHIFRGPRIARIPERAKGGKGLRFRNGRTRSQHRDFIVLGEMRKQGG